MIFKLVFGFLKVENRNRTYLLVYFTKISNAALNCFRWRIIILCVTGCGKKQDTTNCLEKEILCFHEE